MADTKATGAERVADSLRARILHGQFPAGAPLREEELAAHYQVSRHVVREVLRKLAAEGIAEYSSFRGARIPLLAAEDVTDIYRARQFIECGSLLAAAGRIEVRRLAEIHGSFEAAVVGGQWDDAFEHDFDFHACIVSAGGSDRLAAWHKGLLRSLKLAHLAAPDFQSRGLTMSVPQHAEVVLALAAADIPRAGRALERHLADCECLLLEGLASGAGRQRSRGRIETA